jgi:hypothetical protein
MNFPIRIDEEDIFYFESFSEERNSRDVILKSPEVCKNIFIDDETRIILFSKCEHTT